MAPTMNWEEGPAGIRTSAITAYSEVGKSRTDPLSGTKIWWSNPQPLHTNLSNDLVWWIAGSCSLQEHPKLYSCEEEQENIAFLKKKKKTKKKKKKRKKKEEKEEEE